MIGNSDVADVLPLSERSIYVLGKKFGTTSLTLYDRSNRVIAVMDVSVGPDPGERSRDEECADDPDDRHPAAMFTSRARARKRADSRWWWAAS